MRFTSLNTDAPVRFEYGKPPESTFTRYLSLDGVRAYWTGMICETCHFFFERLGGANRCVSVEALRKRFRAGLSDVDATLIETIGPVIPAGEYEVSLREVTPTLVTPCGVGDYFSHEVVSLWGMDSFYGLPHYPKTQYYRTFECGIADHAALYEFIVPMLPPYFIDAETWVAYAAAMLAGGRPTALAISVLDVKQPATYSTDDPPIHKHYCLAHFLLDGHHKVYAASQARRPLSVLSFLSLGESIASEEEMARALTAIGAGV